MVNNDGGRPKFSLRFNKSVSGDNASPAASNHHRRVPDQPGDLLRHQFEGIDAISPSSSTLVKFGPRRMEDAITFRNSKTKTTTVMFTEQDLIPVGNAVPDDDNVDDDRGANKPRQPPLGNGHRPGLPKLVQSRNQDFGDAVPDHNERRRLIHLPPSIHGLVSRVERKYRRKTMEELIERSHEDVSKKMKVL